MNLIIGSHVSFKSDTQLVGSVKEALSYDANAFMIYTGAPQNTIRKSINDNLTKEANELMIFNGMNKDNIIVHAPYIINLANGSVFAINFLKQEIKRCEKLGITKLVLHPGSAVKLDKEIGIKNIINGLNEVLQDNTNIIICLETMSGKGSEIGSTFEELKMIIDGVVKKDNIGICLDTCHLNDSGYDISNFSLLLNEFDKLIGIDRIKCVHINDSKNEMRSKKDRHANIGLGLIGFDNIINIIYNDQIKDVPKILETPYISETDEKTKISYPPYKFEIKQIKDKIQNKELINKIREYYK